MFCHVSLRSVGFSSQSNNSLVLPDHLSLLVTAEAGVCARVVADVHAGLGAGDGGGHGGPGPGPGA